MPKLSRRAMIGLAGSFIASAAVYSGGLLVCRSIPRNTPDFFASLEPQDLEAIKRVGARVIKAVPDFRDFSHIESLLSSKPLLTQASRTTCAKTRLALVQKQCRQDFQKDDYLFVDGWMLSKTEAALCASLIA